LHARKKRGKNRAVEAAVVFFPRDRDTTRVATCEKKMSGIESFFVVVVNNRRKGKMGSDEKPRFLTFVFVCGCRKKDIEKA
jgi:hypothetical protein